MKRLLAAIMVLCGAASLLLALALPAAAADPLCSSFASCSVRVHGTNEVGVDTVAYCVPVRYTATPLYCNIPQTNQTSGTTITGTRYNWHPTGSRGGYWVNVGTVVAMLVSDATYPNKPLRWDVA